MFIAKYLQIVTELAATHILERIKVLLEELSALCGC